MSGWLSPVLNLVPAMEFSPTNGSSSPEGGRSLQWVSTWPITCLFHCHENRLGLTYSHRTHTSPPGHYSVGSPRTGVNQATPDGTSVAEIPPTTPMTCGTSEVVPIRWKQGPTSRLVKLPPAAGFALAFHLSVCWDVNSLRHTIRPLGTDLSYLTMPPQSDGAKNSETLSQDKSSPVLERWLCSEE